jgi:hypothetical protein
MKKLLFASLIFISSCKPKTEEKVNLVTIKHDGCEYVVANDPYHAELALVHKANCSKILQTY